MANLQHRFVRAGRIDSGARWGARLISSRGWAIRLFMFQAKKSQAGAKPAQYADLVQQAEGLLGDETDGIANAANLAALIYDSLGNLNWAGFYFLRDGEWCWGRSRASPPAYA